jgi:hypothetical protein
MSGTNKRFNDPPGGNDGTQLVTDIASSIGLSDAGLRLMYRLQGLEDRRKYGIMLVKFGETWVYAITPGEKVECANANKPAL